MSATLTLPARTTAPPLSHPTPHLSSSTKKYPSMAPPPPATRIALPAPLPSLFLRAITSAAFAITALALMPFFIVGMLFRCVGHPLVSLYERWSRPKTAPRHKRVAGGQGQGRGKMGVTGNGNGNGVGQGVPGGVGNGLPSVVVNGEAGGKNASANGCNDPGRSTAGTPGSVRSLSRSSSARGVARGN